MVNKCVAWGVNSEEVAPVIMCYQENIFEFRTFLAIVASTSSAASVQTYTGLLCGQLLFRKSFFYFESLK